ncbi:MAG: hypothetical protein ACYDDV_00355 [Methanoregula sp.]
MKKKRVIDEEQYMAAHESGHLLGYLAAFKIKNGLKFDSKSLSCRNHDQIIELMKENCSPEYIEDNFPEFGLTCSPKTNQKLTAVNTFYAHCQQVLIGTLGIAGSLFYCNKTEQKPDFDKIVWESKTDRELTNQFLDYICKETGFERETLVNIFHHDCHQILTKNTILFNNYIEAMIQTQFDLPNERIIDIKKQFGFLMPVFIQQDFDRLNAVRSSRK